MHRTASSVMTVWRPTSDSHAYSEANTDAHAQANPDTYATT